MCNDEAVRKMFGQEAGDSSKRDRFLEELCHRRSREKAVEVKGEAEGKKIRRSRDKDFAGFKKRI